MFGVLPVHKPSGWTSRDVCNRVTRLARPHRIGHTGTLDPMATGVLLLAVGSAARLVEFSLGHSKDYEAEFEFGLASDTLDAEGRVQPVTDVPVPSRAELEAELGKWVGCVWQVPPKYSAINIGGRRAYDLARQGKEFELAARPVRIEAISLLQYVYPRWTVHVCCGSGTYIRSLGSDVARGLGSDAIMVRLVRTRVGPFYLDECVDVERLQTPTEIAACLRPPQLLLANLPTFQLNPAQATDIRNGIPLRLAEDAQRLSAVDCQDSLVAVLERGTPLSAESMPCEKACTPSVHLYRSLRVFQVVNETAHPSSINTPHNPES